jgi:uncharacterized protein (DUF1684 family)
VPLRTFRVLVLIAAAAAAACTSGPSAPDDSSYLGEVAEYRASKDRDFRETDDPIPANRRDELLPLRYYPPDPNYAVPAQLRLSDERPIVEVATSTGTRRSLQLVGALEFTLNGQQLSLGALSPPGEPIRNLFVPFADLTTGEETYSAGRYLDIVPTSTGIYTIDFNYAYNPTCAYNASYECPYPPASNRLKVPILAGEKAPGV